jgi:hypothetical protein
MAAVAGSVHSVVSTFLIAGASKMASCAAVVYGIVHPLLSGFIGGYGCYVLALSFGFNNIVYDGLVIEYTRMPYAAQKIACVISQIFCVCFGGVILPYGAGITSGVVYVVACLYFSSKYLIKDRFSSFNVICCASVNASLISSLVGGTLIPMITGLSAIQFSLLSISYLVLGISARAEVRSRDIHNELLHFVPHPHHVEEVVHHHIVPNPPQDVFEPDFPYDDVPVVAMAGSSERKLSFDEYFDRVQFKYWAKDVVRDLTKNFVEDMTKIPPLAQNASEEEAIANERQLAEVQIPYFRSLLPYLLGGVEVVELCELMLSLENASDVYNVMMMSQLHVDYFITYIIGYYLAGPGKNKRLDKASVIIPNMQEVIRALRDCCINGVVSASSAEFNDDRVCGFLRKAMEELREKIVKAENGVSPFAENSKADKEFRAKIASSANRKETFFEVWFDSLKSFTNFDEFKSENVNFMAFPNYRMQGNADFFQLWSRANNLFLSVCQAEKVIGLI